MACHDWTMTGATARQRAAITISFGLQAALIAALLGIPASDSAHHAQAARAGPAAEPPVGATLSSTHLSLREQIGGGAFPAVRTDEIPWVWAAPPYLVYVPPGMAEPVTITVTNPGPAPASNVWFALAPDDQVTQPGLPMIHIFPVMSKVSLLPPGVTTFRFTVPAADLRRGSFPIIVMGVQEGSTQATYALIQLDPNGDSG
jgi:hypothetical protein